MIIGYEGPSANLSQCFIWDWVLTLTTLTRSRSHLGWGRILSKYLQSSVCKSVWQKLTLAVFSDSELFNCTVESVLCWVTFRAIHTRLPLIQIPLLRTDNPDNPPKKWSRLYRPLKERPGINFDLCGCFSPSRWEHGWQMAKVRF